MHTLLKDELKETAVPGILNLRSQKKKKDLSVFFVLRFDLLLFLTKINTFALVGLDFVLCAMHAAPGSRRAFCIVDRKVCARNAPRPISAAQFAPSAAENPAREMRRVNSCRVDDKKSARHVRRVPLLPRIASSTIRKLMLT